MICGDVSVTFVYSAGKGQVPSNKGTMASMGAPAPCARLMQCLPSLMPEVVCAVRLQTEYFYTVNSVQKIAKLALPQYTGILHIAAGGRRG